MISPHHSRNWTVAWLVILGLLLGVLKAGAQAPAAPTFNPAAGAYYTKKSVLVTCPTVGATIYYTVNGTSPNLASSTLVSGTPVLIDRNLTLKAAAYLAGAWSTVTSADYSVTGQIAAGAAHALTLPFDGTTVRGVGNNSSGQLSLGTLTNALSPTAMKANSTTLLANVFTVAGGASHSLLLKTDNSVQAVGANADGQLGNNTYGFDDIGNRRSTVINGRESRYVANLLNQYSSRTVPGVVDVFGSAGNGTVVSVNGEQAARQGRYFSKAAEIDNTVVPYAGALKVVAAKKGAGPGGIDLVTEELRTVFVPATPEAFIHDADGNLTQDGRWNYTWDGENRLTVMETRSDAPAAISRQKLVFDYDHASRRIRKRVYSLTTGGWNQCAETRFVYDGWNLLAELDGTNTVLRSYTWGLDLSDSGQAAGGVGGLLFIRIMDRAITLTPSYDGNGNVMRLINMAGAVAEAEYDYGCFGEPLRATGALAGENPFRFSTKYEDLETGGLYYGYRFYQPSAGSWVGVNQDLSLSFDVATDEVALIEGTVLPREGSR